MVIFAGEKNLQKCWQDLSRGGNFYNILPISLIKFYGFYFPAGKFPRKRSYREKHKNSPRRKFSRLSMHKAIKFPSSYPFDCE